MIQHEGQQGDPGHVGQNHVHGEVAAHQKDAIAKALLGGNCFCCNQEQPGAAQRQPCGIEQPRRQLRQQHSQQHLPGAGAQGLGLDQLFVWQAQGVALQVSNQKGRHAHHDQRDLGRFPGAKGDEQDRQNGHGRYQRRYRDQRRELGAQQRNAATQDAHHQADQRADTDTDQQPFEAGESVGPQYDLAGAHVLGRGQVVKGLRHAAGEGSRRSLGLSARRALEALR